MNNSYFDYSTAAELKEIPIYTVFTNYVGGGLKRQGNHRFVAHCPWHGGAGGDKNPSLVLFTASNTWHCFGCSQGGSTIDLVMKALNLDFKAAVMTMVADFGIPLPESTPQELAKARERNLATRYKRRLETRFKELENRVYQRLASLYRGLDRKLHSIRTQEDLDRFGGLYHVEVYLEHVLDVLIVGTPVDKLGVLKNNLVRRWCGWH